ncbi:Sigma-70 region 2 [Clostridium cavendishii DSM 21758]|uniref:Sigma-70 region 2 n=1 Tax=Clostridium cavendishii DSM 21758 TaxID=1121302 RepID=A0A1M6S0C3_9CLOT|nr:sigma-70 family RNA polymerase sigma factor [Clostridium cavendishii]SHK38214.1 Sigma-70 region 2 [Clostridium cavendishii DSM 21758]
MIRPEDHLKLVSYVIGKKFSNYLGNFEYDDLFQMGCVGLIKACNTYDEKRGVFSSYAFMNIWGIILKYIKDSLKNAETVSLDDLINENTRLIEFYLVDDNSFEKVENMILVNELLKETTKLQRKYIELYYFEDLTLKEIGDKFNTTKQAIDFTKKQGLKRIARRCERL